MGLRKPRGNNAPSRLADDDELKSFTLDEEKRGYKEIEFRCGKCSGTGRYWGPGGVCFGCDGHGKVIGRLYTPEKREELDAATEKRHADKQAKKEKKRMDVLGQSLQTYPEAHKISARLLDEIDADGRDHVENKYGGFIVDVATKGQEWGFSDKQATSLVAAYGKRTESLEKREEEHAKLTAAPDGRQIVRGEVVHATIRETQFGATWKMIVLDDRMFKVWSTVPKDIRTQVGTPDDLIGARVELTVTLEVSRKDETFSFGSHPKSASVLENASDRVSS